ncbi:arginine--tRNA ligase [Candidatus Saccharibacteria bacterium]|nr:arginine--tRNA ligase [Candidatus Saccharibacteria bacterium]
MNQIASLISLSVKDLFEIETQVELTRPDPNFGDLTSNVALKIAKQVSKPPRDVASVLADALSNKSELVSKIEVAGPGFLNLWLTDSALLDNLKEQQVEQINSCKKILVEYSDPNPFKPLHAGHLYTTLVGDTIARLIERSGAEVIRLNYGGDVGLHVGKAMWAILKQIDGENVDDLAKIQPEQRAQWLGERYVEGSSAYEDNQQAKAEIISINKRVYKVHNEDDKTSAFAKIYWECRAWSYDYLRQLYAELEVEEFDRFIPESEVFRVGLDTVLSQLKKGVYQESEGAIVYRGEEKDLHTRVFINSEGLPTYEAKEVGLLLLKWRDYQFDQSIMITANEQVQYMQVVLASVAEFEPMIVERTKHIAHGMVKLSGGVKMSSRKGSVVTAKDIISSASEAAKNSSNDVSQNSVLAAIKYAFTKNKIGGDVVYSPEESVALEGNSGPYLQYAHARAASIIAKRAKTGNDNLVEQKSVHELALGEDQQLDNSERRLVAKLGEYSEVINTAIAELSPHLINSYIYELAQEFNRFYENSRVIGSDKQHFRLALVAVYADTLKDGLSLLGIDAPNEM